MKIRSKYSLLFLLAFIIIACKKDDDGVVFVPPEDLGEIFVQDEAKLQAYFETHFYNYEEFENPQPGFDYKILIDTIAGANSDKISLKNSPSFGFNSVEVNSSQFGTVKEESIAHKVYYIIARQGVGASPTFADSTYVQYEGSLLDGSIFDSSSVPVWFDLTTNIPGFSQGITSLKAGGDFTENGDGTITVNDFGVGAIFMPSALAYYSNSGNSGIPAYSPLVFKLNLVAVSQIDHDRDGIPSYMEDLNANGNLSDDNTDIDTENSTQLFLPNYVDSDDDGDGKLTRDEIIINEDGSIEFPDADGDGVPDYLDKDTR